MRTTLKRGIGRGAGVNGNGKAVLPPGSMTPVARYQQPPRRHPGWILVGKMFLWGGAIVFLFAGALAGGAYLFFHKSVGAVQAKSANVKRAQKDLKLPPPPNEPAVALVIGYDARPHEHGGRSDTLMLLRAQPDPKAVSMMSIPRDLQAEIHCPGQTPYLDKINAAYSLCGATGALDTVKALTGLPISYLVTVNFTGFRDVVDRLGGVWVDVDRRYYHSNAGLAASETYDQINIQPGYQKLDGGDALHFVRYRHTDNDFIRGARQQAFVQALNAQASHSISITKLPGVVSAIVNNIEVGVGGGHKLSERTVFRYATFALGMPSGRFFQTKINGLVAGPSYVTADQGDINAAVHDFQNPDVEASTKAAARAGVKKIHHHGGAPLPSRTTIALLNGNNIAGSASQGASQLQSRGYKIVFPPNGLPANAPNFDYFRTAVYYGLGHKARNKAAAQKVANLFGDADVGPMPANIRRLSNGAMLVVVVGKTFHGTIAPSPVDHTPPKQPPSVESGVSATLPLLKPLKHQVPFKVEVPKLIELGSIPDPEKPVRVYRLEGKHKAIRLTFRRGSGYEYYGIEETDWKDAPALNGGEHHKIKGRDYTFYWNGPHLHMVVLNQGDATYWVVNSLLDSLSNETMIAIAKSLRPLPLKHL